MPLDGHDINPRSMFLSRLRFGFVIRFRRIFAAFNIGLATRLATFEGMVSRWHSSSVRIGECYPSAWERSQGPLLGYETLIW